VPNAEHFQVSFIAPKIQCRVGTDVLNIDYIGYCDISRSLNLCFYSSFFFSSSLSFFFPWLLALSPYHLRRDAKRLALLSLSSHNFHACDFKSHFLRLPTITGQYKKSLNIFYHFLESLDHGP